jgi:hypothetical protein
MMGARLFRLAAALAMAAVAGPLASIAAQETSTAGSPGTELSAAELDSAPVFEASPSGWVAASVYLHPAEDDLLAGAGLRGSFALDGYAFDAFGFRLALDAYTNAAGLGDSAAWTWSQPDPLSVAAAGNGRLLAAFDLKEAWFDFAVGDIDARIGKQVLAWGLADGSNPTDTLNARHVGTRLVSTLDEQKMGSLALNLVYNLPGNLGTVQGVFLPVSVPNDMSSIAMDLLIPGVIHVIIEEDQTPEFAAENVEGGLRALFYTGSVSFSASWLTCLDRYPDFNSVFVPAATPVLTLTPFHSRVNQFGLDAAWLVGGFDLRAEGALTITADVDGTDDGIKNSYLSGVVQGSRTFLDGMLTASLAWAPRYVFNHVAPTAGGTAPADMLAEYNGQAYAFEQTGSLRLAGKFLGETLQPEALFLASLEARDYLATVSVAYNLADGVNLKGGAGLYGSFREEDDPEREWGTFSNRRTIDKDYLYLELRVSL